MRILLVGVGTVGESIARLAAAHPWCETMVLADYDAARAEALQASLGAMRSGSRSSTSTPVIARPSPRWRGAIGLTWS